MISRVLISNSRFQRLRQRRRDVPVVCVTKIAESRAKGPDKGDRESESDGGHMYESKSHLEKEIDKAQCEVVLDSAHL